MAEKFKTKPKVLFGPGIYVAENGVRVEKSAADCAEMVLNFSELAERGEFPAVTKGHPHDTSAPKYGELQEAWIDPAGNHIVGPLAELPKDLATAIEAGEFDKISIVFRDKLWDPVAQKYRNNVITEVGVLGAKWGAFKQPDKLTIDWPMAEAGGKGVRVYRLSMADMEVAPDNGGGEDVEDKERKGLEATIEELKAKIVELEAAAPDEEKESLKAELAEVKEKLELAAKAKAAADEKIAEAEKDAKKVKVDEALTGLVTADDKGNVKATPAETDALRPTMMAMDDSKTIKLAEGEDGEDVMGSELDRYIATFEHRPVVLKLAEKGVDDSDKLHKGKEPEKKSALSDMDREIAVKCGLDPDEVERVNAPGYDPHADVAAAQAKRDEK